MILVSKLERADLACLCRLSHQTPWVLATDTLHTYRWFFFVAEQKDFCARASDFRCFKIKAHVHNYEFTFIQMKT
jgi:hypothetical protein